MSTQKDDVENFLMWKTFGYPMWKTKKFIYI